jgi:hypothetical protein
MTSKNQESLEDILRELVDLKYKTNRLYGIEPAKPTMKPPASEKDLEQLEAELERRGLPLPPSYRDFLVACNGIKAFNGDLDLVSAKGVLKAVEEELEEDFPGLSRLVVARGNTPEFISLDPDTADKNGEMEAVWVMGDGGQFRYKSLGALLQSLRDELRKTHALATADRKS